MNVIEYKYHNATIRIHDNSSNEERKPLIEKAAQKFMKSVLKQKKDKEKATQQGAAAQ